MSNLRICTPDSAPWKDVSVPLSAWRGQTVKIEVVLTADGWWYEFPYLARLEVGEGNDEAKATIDGYTWSYRINNGEATIEAKRGGKFVCAVSPSPKGHLTIPSTLGGAKVTGIGVEAFLNTQLTSLTIPACVKTIGDGAFSKSLLTSVTIPAGVETIRHGAFAWIAGLESISIPASVKDICCCAFIGSEKLMKFEVDPDNPNYSSRNRLLCSKDGTALLSGVNGDVVVPNGVSCITRSAFIGCQGLKSVAIPSSVTRIESGAFWETGLEAVTIPASVRHLDYGAFWKCRALSSVKMLGERPEIRDDRFVFGACDNLKEIHVPANAKSWAGMKEWLGKKLVFDAKADAGAMAKNSCAVKDRTTVQSIIDGMIKVPGRDYWLSETELTQGQWEAVMGYNLSVHKGANLPVENVSRDDCDVFIEKFNQTKEVKDSRFEFHLPELEEWKYAAWAGSAGHGTWIKSGVVGDVCDIAWVRENSSNQTHAVATKLPNAFGFYDMLGNVWEWLAGEAGVPQGRGKGALKGTSFGYASDKCTWNANWYLPKSYCNSTIGLRLAAHIRSNKASVSARPRQRGSILARRNDMDGGAQPQATVDGYTWSYRVENGEATIEAKNDGKFVCAVSPNPTGNMVIPSLLNGMKVTSIGQEAFCHYCGPKSVKIPEGVESIGWCAFYMCTNLASVTLPMGLNSIGHGAFAGCDKLSSVVIPEGVTNISADAFRFCRGLKSVNIPSGVKRINENTFDLCNSLQSIEIPNGVEGIDRAAFYNCWELKSVEIPSSVRVIGPAAFNRCHGLCSLTIGSGVKEIGEAAFEFCGGLTEVAMLGERPNAPKDIFKGCDKLTAIHVPANAKSWAGMKEWQGKKLVFDAKEK